MLYVNTKKSLLIPTGNTNSYIEGQTTQWSNERGQTDKQWSTKDTHKTKDRIMSNPNPIFTGSLQWLVYIDLTVYQCMRKMNLNLFYDFSTLVYFWIGISWLIEHSSFDHRLDEVRAKVTRNPTSIITRHNTKQVCSLI